ncbi:MAG: DUF4062 domain-containing protein [Eubacteriales bacterium]|nr:DUF4062 domain-containing protein [Eubacteriales bacterium]
MRVFISSTFKDFHAERNALVLIVFPRVEAYCQQRGVSFFPVDLRWGITQEQAERGETVATCMREAEECRPYFIGMLGNRYGWIPPGAEISVTELEFERGVFSQGADASRALIYLRSDGLSELQYPGNAEPPSAKSKLSLLKRRVIEGAYHCLNGYNTIDEFAVCVDRDLRMIVDRDFPPTMMDPLAAERISHMQFSRACAEQGMPRKALYKKLSSYLAQPGSTPLVVSGIPGSGKSSLLGGWLWQQMGSGCFVLAHFFGKTADNSWQRMAARFVDELSTAFTLEMEVPEEDEALIRTFTNALYMASARGGKPIIILLDGLEQASSERGLSWLPLEFPNDVHVFLSAKTGPVLDTLRNRGYPELRVGRMTASVRSRLAVDYLGKYAKHLNEETLGRIVRAPAAGNAMFLHTLLNELRLFGSFEGLESRVDWYLEAGSLPGLFLKLLERLAENFPHQHVERVLSLFACAGCGLTESEMLRLSGAGNLLWSSLRAALSPFLLDVNGVLSIRNRAFLSAVTSIFPVNEKKTSIRLKLREYFEQIPANRRAMDELPVLYEKSREWDALGNYLSNVSVFDYLWSHNSFEFKRRWVLVENNTGIKKEAAFAGVIRSDIPPETGLKLARFFQSTGNTQETMVLLNKVIAASHPQTRTYQLALGYKGNLLHVVGDTKTALLMYQQQREACIVHGNEMELQRALGNTGLVHFARGEYRTALRLFEEAEAICRKLRYHDGLQVVLGNEGHCYYAIGELDLAKDKYLQQKALCAESKNTDGIMTALGSLCIFAMRKGELQNAIRCGREQEKLARSMHNMSGLQNALNNLAQCYFQYGAKEEALLMITQAEDICRKSGNAMSLQKVLLNKMEIFTAYGNIPAALSCSEERIEICRRCHLILHLCDALYRRAVLLNDAGRQAESMVDALQAHAIALQNNSVLLSKIEYLLNKERESSDV